MERPRHPRHVGIPYREALLQIEEGLPLANYSHVAEAVGKFLLNWNWSFYRSEQYIAYLKIERCIRDNFGKLTSYRGRTIGSFDSADEVEETEIRLLFKAFLDATVSVRNDARSPVSAAKALHILAPEFFPAWDNEIAYAYDCSWVIPEVGIVAEFAASCYLSFIEKVQQCWILLLESYRSDKEVDENQALSAICNEAYSWHSYHPSLLKLIDEVNMARFSNWR
jgi:hypothetical protein